MSTLNDLVLEVQRRVLSSMREETNTLGPGLDNDDTTLNLASNMTLGNIQPNSLIQIDYELMLVQQSIAPTGPVTVVRGYYDSVAASHNSGATINVNPRFPAVDIIKAINEDIDDLSAPTNGLYQMLEVTLTYNPVIVGYDLIGLTSTKVMELWEVRAHDYGPAQAWDLIPPSMYKLQRNADTSIFPSGLALELYRPGYPGRPLRVQYKSPYTTPLVNPSDDVLGVTGLHTQAHDIPVMGAAYRLMAWREFKRSFNEAQGEPRRAQEVPVGSSLTAVKLVQKQRDDRIAAERERLNKMWPRSVR